MSVTASTVFRRRAGAEASRFGAETVLLDPQGTMLRGLNPTAARVWELLDGRQTAAEIASRLSQEFPVPPERALCDVVEFLSGLEERALVEKMGGGMR